MGDARTQHAAKIESLQGEWRRQEELVTEQAAEQREVAQRDFDERLQEREATHADELAQARAATLAAEARAGQLAADVASLHEQLSALNDCLAAETQGRLQAAAESEQARAELEDTRAELENTRTQHAARIESLQVKWRRTEERVAEEAARQREVAQRQFEERLQEREAANADELAQARAATLAAGARAEQLAADMASLHEQRLALNRRLEAETQGRLQATADLEQALVELEGTRTELENTRTQHAARIESLQGEWRRQEQLVTEQAAKQLEVAQREFADYLQEREAAHADEFAQARAATSAAEARAERLVEELESLHGRLSSLQGELEQEKRTSALASSESQRLAVEVRKLGEEAKQARHDFEQLSAAKPAGVLTSQRGTERSAGGHSKEHGSTTRHDLRAAG